MVTVWRACAPADVQRMGRVFWWGVGDGVVRQVMDGLWTEARGRQKQSNDPGNNQHNRDTPTTGRR